MAPLGRALEQYFGKFADERTGVVLGMGENATDGLTTGIGITGQVVDDQTGKPIPQFVLEWRVADPKQPGGEMAVQHNCEAVYFGGRFGSQFRQVNSVWSMVEFCVGGRHGSGVSLTDWVAGQKVWARIRADGYLTEPVTPVPVVWPVKLTNLMVRLKRASASAQPTAPLGGSGREEAQASTPQAYTSRGDALGRPLRPDDFDAEFREP